jgi:CTP synthase
MAEYVLSELGLPQPKPDLRSWSRLVEVIRHPSRPTVKIGVVAKYMNHEDTYTSVFEALKAAAWANKVAVEIHWIDCEQLEKGNTDLLDEVDGIVVPGGFGPRGVEGKIRAGEYALDHQKPYLGLCLGMQTAVIALGRRVLGTRDVNSTEMNPDTKHPVISLMADQEQVTDKGGTMRLGNYVCKLAPGSISRKAYGEGEVVERHRHRYEFNNSYREVLAEAGLKLAGLSPDGRLVELIEMAGHPYFVASQFHPEFKSRPNRAHPLFDGFIKAVTGKTAPRSKVPAH